MILIFGGTTEGRAAIRVAAQGVCAQGVGAPGYIYSTLGDAQQVDTPGGERLTGGLSADQARELCRRRGVRLVVDAAHPFASGVHATAAACGLPVVRYERQAVEAEGAVWCDDFGDAARRLEKDGVRRLLALTGVRTIPKLRDFWSRHPTRFRVLDRPASIAEALAAGLERENLLPGDDFGDADAVLTKDSGASGGLPAKIARARELGIPVYIVRRPPMPAGFHTVYTEAGLRRRIEQLLPGYFALRSGLSTGTTATAAAVAALPGLLGKPESDPDPAATTALTNLEVEVVLPGGERVSLPVESSAPGEATVRKEAGDDPDVTDGCLITARVELSRKGGIRFLPGSGVGRVTLPGLGIEVGEPAVNPAPRRMIVENFAAHGVLNADVTISVAGGAELAEKTFNPRLGIVGGISILGTSGFVEPFSAEAFVEAVAREIDVAWAVGCRRLVVNSGARSEAAVRKKFPELPPQAFVHYGNAVGETLRLAAAKGFRQVAMGAMMGKAVKLAEGHTDTHSRDSVMNREFLTALARESGCSAEAVRAIAETTLARELWSLPPGDRERFVQALLRACQKHLTPLCPGLELFLVDEEGTLHGIESQPAVGEKPGQRPVRR